MDSFRVRKDTHTRIYESGDFHNFAKTILLRTRKGVELTRKECEQTLEKDIGRDGPIAMTVNGDLPPDRKWTKETLFSKIQQILGDSWEAWKDIMYDTFCISITQTSLLVGLHYFQNTILETGYALLGTEDGKQLFLTLNPETGAVDFYYRQHLTIINTRNPEHSARETNTVFTEHIHFRPEGDTFSGHISYTLDLTASFFDLVGQCDTVLEQISERVRHPSYSLFGKPTEESLNDEQQIYLERLADKIISVVDIRTTFREVPVLSERVREIFQPYFHPSERIYSITPDYHDSAIAYLLIMNDILTFINTPKFVRLMKLAQNVTTHEGKIRHGFFHIRDIREKIPIHIVLRTSNGIIPVLRFRFNKFNLFISADERYRLEQEALRSGQPILQPIGIPFRRTAETLPEGVSKVARRIGLLGGGHRMVSKTYKHSKNTKHTIKQQYLKTRRI
jgi:hypothetical protein